MHLVNIVLSHCPITLANLPITYTTYIRHYMTQVTGILLHNGIVHLLHIIVTCPLFVHPLRKMRHNELQISDGKVTRFNVVIAQVLCLVSRIDRSESLLCSELIHGICCLFRNPTVQHGFFIIRSICIGNQSIAPVDSIDIINTQYRWSKFHATLHIARLRHEIVARIVHNTRSSTILLSKRWTTQRIYRKCITGTHVMHQAQCMSDFMYCHITN